MIERGLKGVRLVVGDRCAGLVATVGEMLPQARYQRCMVHFMRVFVQWNCGRLSIVFQSS